MADKADIAFDFNVNFRAFRQDYVDFQKACKKNKEPDASTILRRMMADYTEGSISYNVQQED